MLNILSNFFLHEVIVVRRGDWDPPWFNKIIKRLIQVKNVTFKHYPNSSGNIDSQNSGGLRGIFFIF